MDANASEIFYAPKYLTDKGLSGYRARVTFGENLKRLREARGWSQETLAKKMGYESGRNTQISLDETSGKLPTPEKITRYAEALGCSTGELLHDVLTPYDLLRDEQVKARAGPKSGQPPARRKSAG